MDTIDTSRYTHKISCESCGSSDANAVYTDGHTYCFSCETYGETDESIETKEQEALMDFSKITLETRGFKERKITKAVSEFFNVQSKAEDGIITEHHYPYTRNGSQVASKLRTVASKDFRALGDMKDIQLFGESHFNGGRKIVVTEGELDAMAVAQANLDKYNKVFPVVSVPSGAASAKKAVLNSRDFLRGFDEVILWFDNDEPGQKAMQECAKIIGSDKVKLVSSPHKDACDAYLKEGQKIDTYIWDAKSYCPAGIINGKDAWEQYIGERDAVYIEYPEYLPMLNKKLFGRRLGSITMITSGTGCGKTQFIREDIYHLLKNTDDMIGICSLEESIAETVRGIISLDLNRRVGLPDVETTEEQEKAAFDRTLGTGRILLLDHQGSVSDSSLTDKLQFLAASGCKHIFLDHITIAVSETEGDNVNAATDRLMSDLLKICKQFDVWIGVVSHLRKTGLGQESFEEGGSISMDDLRGSGSLKQISSQIIALSRNQKAIEETQRNLVKVEVLKDRFTGGTGFSGTYSFNFQNGRLEWTDDSDAFKVIKQDG